MTFCYQEMKEAFDLIHPESNWSGPISMTMGADMVNMPLFRATCQYFLGHCNISVQAVGSFSRYVSGSGFPGAKQEM